MQFTDTQIDAGLDGRLPATVFASAHTAFSSSGANEVAGGTYARQEIEMDAASGRVLDNTNEETFGIPSGTTVAYVGLWDAASAGTFLGMFPLNATVSLVGLAKAADNTLHFPAHGFAPNDEVVLFALGGSMPGGLSEGVIYHVIGAPNADDFQVSATQGGAAVAIASSASIICSDITPEVFGADGQMKVPAGGLDIVGLA